MTQEEFQKAYSELCNAVERAKKQKKKRIRMSLQNAITLEMYVFDPECAIDSEFEDEPDQERIPPAQPRPAPWSKGK
ncbi:MAG: hypothetical protein ACTS8S_00935 [Giesbergeria sp.]